MCNDPNIVQQFAQYPADYQRWNEFTSLQIPVGVLRGVDSDLLTETIVQQMQTALPHMQLAEFAHCGHAPAQS